VTAGSQPDWYMGIAEGLLRIMPGWETHLFGHTISWNVLFPGQLAPVMLLMIVLAWPFLEAWVTGDKREHHLLQRPRNAPTRTALMVSLMTFYGLMWMAGGNDIIALKMKLSINQITYFNRVAVFVGPLIAFIITRRWCISLQRADNEMLLHGLESGVIMRDAQGGYTEKHVPLPADRAYTLTARVRDEVFVPDPEADANGVSRRKVALDKLRAGLSRLWYNDNIQKPTKRELEDAHHHAELEAAHDAPLEGHAADGHQFDGRHDIEDEHLSRPH